MAVLHVSYAKLERRWRANSAVASVQSAFLVKLAHLAGTVPIALLALTRIKAGRNACHARRVLGAALSEQMTLRRAKTALQGNIRRQKVWQSSQVATHAVWAGSL